MMMMMIVENIYIKIIIVCHVHSTLRCVLFVFNGIIIFCIVVRTTGLRQVPALIQCAQQVTHNNHQINLCNQINVLSVTKMCVPISSPSFHGLEVEKKIKFSFVK